MGVREVPCEGRTYTTQGTVGHSSIVSGYLRTSMLVPLLSPSGSWLAVLVSEAAI